MYSTFVIQGHSTKMSFYSGILYAKFFCGVSQVVQPWASARGQSISGSVATGHHSSGTLCKNLGNGSFADFLAAISVNFIESGARQNRAPILAILPIRPDRARSIRIRPINGTAQSIGIGPNQTRSDPIGSQFWRCSRSKTQFW